MLNQFAFELLRDLNYQRGSPLYHDTSLSSFFESITLANEFQQTPCINPQDILQLISNHGNEVHFLSDHIMKQKTNDYSKMLSGYRNRLSETAKDKFRSMFNKQLSNPLIHQQNFTHCYIYLFENANFYLLLIVLQQKYVVVDSIIQKNTGIHIQGWLNYSQAISGIQFIDGDLYYELQDGDTKQKQVTIDNFNIWIFDLFVDNGSTTILPVIVHKYGTTPIIQFFSDNLIGEVQLKETKSQLHQSHPLAKHLQQLSIRETTTKSNLQNKVEQIKCQKYSGFEQEHQPKIPQTNSKNLELFRIEENQYEQSSAKHDDFELYTRNLESKYLTAPKLPSLIDGLISSESQMINSNPYVPLTHKEQSTLSEIRNNTLYTCDSAINEHLNMLDPKKLENIYQDLCKETEKPQINNTLLQSQQVFQPYNVESLYFSQQHQDNQQQQQIQYPQQQDLQFQYLQQQQLQQQQLQQQQLQQQQQQYIQQQQQQQLYQQYYQQQQYQQQQQQMYQMMQYHQQLQQYPNNLQIQKPEEQCYFEEPSIESPPKKWSFSPQKQSESQVIKKRTSNPEPLSRSSVRYSIRQSIKQQKQSEFQISNTKKLLKKEGIQVRDNEIPFKTKLKINTIQPLDFIDLKSNRAQRKMKEIEQGLLSQSVKCRREHNFNALFKNDKFSDISLEVNGHQYKSHKTVLLQVSPYFKDLLEINHNEIEMQVNSLELFDLVYKYIYFGKLSDSEWNDLGINKSIPFYKLAEQLELYTLIEQLISRVVIPMMTKEFVLDWYLIGFRNQNTQLSYIFKFVYFYTVSYFSLHCKTIVDSIRERGDSQFSVNESKYRNYFDDMTAEETYFLVQQPIMQTDQDGIDNLLWMITEKKKCSHIELLKQLSRDHQENCGFKYKEFIYHEYSLPLVNNQIIVYPQKQGESKKRRSSIFVDQEFQYNDSIFNEYLFYQVSGNVPKINKLVYEMKLSNVVGSQLIISECFASQSISWRLIIEINDKNVASLYLQERGPIKNNLKFMNLDEYILDEALPQFSKLNFISVLIKIVVCDSDYVMYHSYPTNQFHTVGFEDVQQINSLLHIKVYIQEDPLHSALMHWCGQNYTESIVQLPYCTLYSLLRSDMLRISEEKQILKLLYSLQESNQNLDLIIHPIRYLYIPIGDVFSLSKGCQIIRKSRLFQSILNLILNHFMDGKSITMKPRKAYTRFDFSLSQSEFKKEWLKWLIYSDNPQLKINTQELKKEIEIKQYESQQKQLDIQKQIQQQQCVSQYQMLNLTPKCNGKYFQQYQSPKQQCSIF